MQKEFSAPGEALHERLDDFHGQINNIYARIQRLVQDLRPPALEALGLIDAMQSYCTEFTRRTDLPLIFDADEEFSDFSNLYEITLYRTLQEALTNIVKHAQAKKVWVELSMEEEKITLTIQDNGHGFEYNELDIKGMGLRGLKERLLLAGGKFIISSTKKRGTILVAELPLEAKI